MRTTRETEGLPVNRGVRAPSEVNLAPQTTSMKTYKYVYCFLCNLFFFLFKIPLIVENILQRYNRGQEPGESRTENRTREDDRDQSESWRQGRVASTQKKKGKRV